MQADQAIVMGGFAFLVLTWLVGAWLLIKPPKWKKRVVKPKRVYVPRYERRASARGAHPPLTEAEKRIEPELPFAGVSALAAETVDGVMELPSAAIQGAPISEGEELVLEAAAQIPSEAPSEFRDAQPPQLATESEPAFELTSELLVEPIREQTHQPAPQPISESPISTQNGAEQEQLGEASSATSGGTYWVPVEAFGHKTVTSTTGEGVEAPFACTDESSPVLGRRRSLAAIAEAARQEFGLDGNTHVESGTAPDITVEADLTAEPVPVFDSEPMPSDQQVALAPLPDSANISKKATKVKAAAKTRASGKKQSDQAAL